MTTEQKNEITAWLQGPRDYRQGVALYDACGYNKMLKRRFALDNSQLTQALLVEELRKLAGLTEAQFAALPRFAKKPTAKPAKVETVPAKERKPISGEITKMIRFRERFPFLNDADCPNELKIMVADMFTAYGKYRDAHERLKEIDDKDFEAAAAEAETIVENYLADRQMWAAMEYYKVHGELLKEAATAETPDEDITALADVELVDALRNARSNVSKRKKALKAAEESGADAESALLAYNEWVGKRDSLQAEVNRRKKK